MDINEIIYKIKELKLKEVLREDLCDEEGYGDGEACFEDGKSQGKYEAYTEILRMLRDED